MGTLVRSIMPMEVKVEEKQVQRVYQTVEEAKAAVARLGLPPGEIYKLEYYKRPLIDVEAVEFNVNLLVPKICVQKLAGQAQA